MTTSAPESPLCLDQSFSITRRPRRIRQTPAIRSMLAETRLQATDLVAPLFLLEEKKEVEEVPSMPGVFRYPLDQLIQAAEEIYRAGIPAIDLFAVVPTDKKDGTGSYSWNSSNGLVKAIQALKREIPGLWVMVDIALDPFTDHGHDGVIDQDGAIINDATLDALGRMSLEMAAAGVDMLAPSDMMDGRVGYLRGLLDQAGFTSVGIMAYTAKYASGFYGPFRDALHSAPKFGDKSTYQMDPANSREALLEATLDVEEGADMLMVKPALPYLDVVRMLRDRFTVPIGAYHVSGEYAMVKAADARGWIDGERVMHESLLSIKRAGADFIFTYAALEVLAYQEKLR